MHNGNIQYTLPSWSHQGIRCQYEDGEYYITAFDVDVINGRIYGINFANSGRYVNFYDDGDQAIMADIIRSVDTILQMLGFDISFDWSSDSADYDYVREEMADGDLAYVFEFDASVDESMDPGGTLREHQALIARFAALPGAVITD